MALWMVRVGKYGEHEQRFRQDSRIYLTWSELQGESLLPTKNYAGVMALLGKVYPDLTPNQLAAWAFQIDRFVHTMQAGDVVAVPLKSSPAIQFGKIAGSYTFEPTNPAPYRHARDVQWLGEPRLRADLAPDIRYSFGAVTTICEVRRNDAERRVRDLLAGGKGLPAGLPPIVAAAEQDEAGQVDLEQVARDQIAAAVLARFKGHGMARLVEGILKAQGYAIYRSPEGPDGGVDILAAPGALGFGSPRICVQVKSGHTPIDAPTLNQLIGAMQNVGAEQGLLVSWGGFKSTVEAQRASKFFSVRFWNQSDLIDQLFEHYDRLDENLRAELPLKRAWLLASAEA